MSRTKIYYFLLFLFFLFLQACTDPYGRSPVDQITETPADIWQTIARTYAP